MGCEGRVRRRFPDAPVVAVGAVVLDENRVLLVRRGQEPLKGEWSIPGGGLELGETLEAAVCREVLEETGLQVRVAGLVEVLDKIVMEEEPRQNFAGLNGVGEPAQAVMGDRREAGRVVYHYVLIDYLCVSEGGTLRSGSDASEARWVTLEDAELYRLAPVTAAVIAKAFQMQHGAPAPPPDEFQMRRL